MARWHSCNILGSAANARQLWQFYAGGKFNLLRQESKLPGEPLSEKLVSKDWGTLFQPRLNVAWLPADKVFVRVAQLPRADAAETQSMVELQLEKLSPQPVAQIVWSFEALPYVRQGRVGEELNPHATGELQTVVVIMAGRHHVEEHLGQLEGQGYLADRLELPLLDELRATKVKENGAWIFPNVGGREGTCMVAWWYDGVLQNLSLIHLPANEARGAILQEQLAQTTWAGELEGWLTSPPKFHLVADEVTAGAWLPLFDLTQAVEVVPPLAPQELAALTARRVAANGTSTNLLPAEFAARYKQQFIDRIWMRALGAVVALYILGVLVYGGFVLAASARLDGLDLAFFQIKGVQQEIAGLGPDYTNTVRLREELKVLQDTIELQYAALESYKALAESLPAELTLNNMNFDRGRKVTFFGTAGSEDRTKVLDFNAKLMEYASQGQKQPFFSKVNSPIMNNQPGQTVLNWNFSCDLRRTDAGE
jgi:hypothetical protein